MRRYTTHAWGEEAWYCFDASPFLPTGTAVTAATLLITTNTNPPAAQSDFTQSDCLTQGKRAYCRLMGGALDQDYLLTWTLLDNTGTWWNRTCLLLCAGTS